MKSLDILTNPAQQARKNTFFGGILSIVLTLIVVIVLLKEYNNFRGVNIRKNLYLDPNPIEE